MNEPTNILYREYDSHMYEAAIASVTNLDGTQPIAAVHVRDDGSHGADGYTQRLSVEVYYLRGGKPIPVEIIPVSREELVHRCGIREINDDNHGEILAALHDIAEGRVSNENIDSLLDDADVEAVIINGLVVRHIDYGNTPPVRYFLTPKGQAFIREENNSREDEYCACVTDHTLTNGRCVACGLPLESQHYVVTHWGDGNVWVQPASEEEINDPAEETLSYAEAVSFAKDVAEDAGCDWFVGTPPEMVETPSGTIHAVSVSDTSRSREYLVARFDITDLDEEERGALSLAVSVQSDGKDAGYRDVEVQSWIETDPNA